MKNHQKARKMIKKRHILKKRHFFTKNDDKYRNYIRKNIFSL